MPTRPCDRMQSKGLSCEQQTEGAVPDPEPTICRHDRAPLIVEVPRPQAAASPLTPARVTSPASSAAPPRQRCRSRPLAAQTRGRRRTRREARARPATRARGRSRACQGMAVGPTSGRRPRAPRAAPPRSRRTTQALACARAGATVSCSRTPCRARHPQHTYHTRTIIPGRRGVASCSSARTHTHRQRHPRTRCLQRLGGTTPGSIGVAAADVSGPRAGAAYQARGP